MEWSEDNKHIKEVKNPRVIETGYLSPQLTLWELGFDEWVFFLKLPGSLQCQSLQRQPLHANLSYANLPYASLTSANLSNADLHPSQLQNVFSLSGTIMPNGVTCKTISSLDQINEKTRTENRDTCLARWHNSK